MRSNDCLKAEYLLIQSQYEAFDQRALSMKALATPLLGAGIAFAAKEKSDIVILATLAVAASLWLLETIWKGYQYAFTDRIILLEKWFRGVGLEDPPPPAFQIYTSWNEVHKRERLRYLFSRMWAPFIALPYVIVILVCVGILLVHPGPTSNKNNLPLGTAKVAPALPSAEGGKPKVNR